MRYYGTDPALPSYARPEYIAALPDLELIGNELGGTRAMHAASKRYIRKWKKEDKAVYDIRRTCEEFFNGFGRTLSAAVGMLYSKAPQVEWQGGEETFSPLWDNIDGAGNNGDVFLKRVTDAGLRDGLVILLTDHPSAPVDPATGERVEVTSENEPLLNLRPRWSMYGRVQAINWQHDVVDNQRVLTLLVLHESVARRDGRYGIERVNRYRELRLMATPEGRAAGWILHEQSGETADKPEDFRVVGSGVFRNRQGQTASFLPVAVGYTGRSEGIMDATIPLLPVAEANLGHWRLSTDLRFNTLVSSFAQPTWTGKLAADTQTGQRDQYAVGPLVGVHMEEGGTFSWTEPSGTGVEGLAKLVLEKLRQIAAQGVSFLASDTRAAETAEAKRLDAAAENATLATAATGIEDMANLALEHLAWFLGLEKPQAPVITLARDFEATTLSAEIMNAYTKGIAEAGIPVRLLLEAWQSGGRIGQDVDLDALELEIMANQAAIAEQKRQEAEEMDRLLKDAEDDVPAAGVSA